jgi:hypothetical protein
VDSSPPTGWRDWLAHAFAVDKYDESSLEPEERALLTRIGVEIAARGLATPAIVYIDSQRHMGWLGAQALVFAQPLVEIVHPFLDPFLKRFGIALSTDEMPTLISAFEKRYAPEYLVQRIEAARAGELTSGPIEPLVEFDTEE